MNRRGTITVLVGVILAVLFMAIATAGEVHFAHAPPALVQSEPATQRMPVVETAEEPVEVQERDRPEPPAWIEAVVRVLFLTCLAIGSVLAARYAWQHRPTLRRPRRRRRHADGFDLLDDVVAAMATDAQTQRAALRRGEPRNAIVECWLRLEAAVTRAGVEQDPSDTPAEFTQRVLADSAVDPRAIATLAALYREARFSEHQMTEESRVAAIDALDTIHDGLRIDRRRSVGAA